ncbi:uncharacterized protein TRAVEDRAFT_43330 [Trametes versicolor FP-101664 SS1]|uniref:uncharacterized protein n=1 Tax=Trametes versicolor (strain FP-101664) TaxID=717944 RepID=UPI000462162C|nr:uncharacterized protein TRAVEDRAFT_43330 [Trametes versicolor FP-101664 SS1]EIW63026.1 hypothetical protein TRAVEDRAFT_43330 [Trametes versicolor FP-101664 SS1]
MATVKKGKKVKKGSAAPSTPLDAPDMYIRDSRLRRRLPSNATREQVSQHTMRHSIATGTFEDVKFFLFSRRKRSGIVYAPRPLFANSALVCKASAHFDFVFAARFVESEMSLRALSGDNRQAASHHAVPLPAVVTDDLEASSSPVGTLTVFTGEEKHNQAQVKADEDTLEDRFIQPLSGEGAADSAVQICRRPGRVVMIEDIAHRTWEAFIYYAYFEQVSFAPLGSQNLARVPTKPYQAPQCSPKSMFRLAEKYGVEKLKQLAAADLQTKMIAHNIFVELFSSFTMTYPGVLDAELQYLRDHIAEEAVYRQIPTWVQALEDGTLPHGATAVLSRVLKGLATGAARYGQQW